VGLDVLHDAGLKSWERRGEEIRSAIEGARGPEATQIELKKLEAADQKQKVAVLRMLSGCGDASALPSIKRFLDADDNQIRVSAINACRGIVEGAPPEEQLPVFEAIEIAKKWKERI
jgi:HEAT repeat protein